MKIFCFFLEATIQCAQADSGPGSEIACRSLDFASGSPIGSGTLSKKQIIDTSHPYIQTMSDEYILFFSRGHYTMRTSGQWSRFGNRMPEPGLRFRFSYRLWDPIKKANY